MLAVFESLLPVFLVILLGLVLKRSRFMSDEMWMGFERASYWILFPALLVETLVKADLTSVPLTGLTLALAGTVASVSALMWLARRPLTALLGITGASYTSLFQTATRWNGFVALAIIAKLFGASGLTMVALALAVMVPLLNPINTVFVVLHAGDTRPSARIILTRVAQNPFIWSCALGLGFNLAGIPIYGPILTTLDIIGRAALGTGLLLVGAGLIIRQALRPSPAVLVASLVKLLLYPLIMAGACTLAGITGEARQVALVCAAVPTAMNGYVLARQLGGDAPLYAAIVTVQTLVSFLTLPLVLVVLG